MDEEAVPRIGAILIPSSEEHNPRRNMIPRLQFHCRLILIIGVSLSIHELRLRQNRGVYYCTALILEDDTELVHQRQDIHVGIRGHGSIQGSRSIHQLSNAGMECDRTVPDRSRVDRQCPQLFIFNIRQTTGCISRIRLRGVITVHSDGIETGECQTVQPKLILLPICRSFQFQNFYIFATLGDLRGVPFTVKARRDSGLAVYHRQSKGLIFQRSIRIQDFDTKRQRICYLLFLLNDNCRGSLMGIDSLTLACRIQGNCISISVFRNYLCAGIL